MKQIIFFVLNFRFVFKLIPKRKPLRPPEKKIYREPLQSPSINQSPPYELRNIKYLYMYNERLTPLFLFPSATGRQQELVEEGRATHTGHRHIIRLSSASSGHRHPCPRSQASGHQQFSGSPAFQVRWSRARVGPSSSNRRGLLPAVLSLSELLVLRKVDSTTGSAQESPGVRRSTRQDQQIRFSNPTAEVHRQGHRPLLQQSQRQGLQSSSGKARPVPEYSSGGGEL